MQRLTNQYLSHATSYEQHKTFMLIKQKKLSSHSGISGEDVCWHPPLEVLVSVHPPVSSLPALDTYWRESGARETSNCH